MIGGMLWFLPALGIWMLPLGVLMIGMCIPYFYRRIRVWMRKLKHEIRAAEQHEKESKTADQEPKFAHRSDSSRSYQDPKIARRSKTKLPRQRR